MEIQDIARICHQANREYCQLLGDDSQPDWAEAKDWQRESAIDGVRFHLENPYATDSASHERWLAHKVKEGWVYGEEKDAEKKTHPSMRPFDQLPKVEQVKDRLFRMIVAALREFTA